MLKAYVLCMKCANYLDSLIQTKFKTAHHIFELKILYKRAIF